MWKRNKNRLGMHRFRYLRKIGFKFDRDWNLSQKCCKIFKFQLCNLPSNLNSFLNFNSRENGDRCRIVQHRLIGNFTLHPNCNADSTLPREVYRRILARFLIAIFLGKNQLGHANHRRQCDFPLRASLLPLRNLQTGLWYHFTVHQCSFNLDWSVFTVDFPLMEVRGGELEGKSHRLSSNCFIRTILMFINWYLLTN